jgi:hypothetical protein
LPPDPLGTLRLRGLRPEQILDLEHLVRAFSTVEEPPAGGAGRP